MKLDYLLTCDSAHDMKEGKAVIVGVFDRIAVGSLPAKHLTMTLAFAVRDLDMTGGVRMSVRFLSPGGEELASFDLPERPAASQTNGKISGGIGMNLIEFKEPGTHAFVLSVNGEELGRRSLEIIQRAS